MDDTVMDYRAVRDSTRLQLREAAVDAAERLLAEEGLEAVSVRRVAALLGASRQVVYTHFGDKRGLVDALYRRGYVRLRRELVAVQDTDAPLDDLRAVLAAYREAALARPALYSLMFGTGLESLRPPVTSVDEAAGSFDVLERCVQRCVEAELFAATDTQTAAEVLWIAVHGVVALELAGFLARPPRARQRFHDAVETALTGLAGR